MPTPRRASLAPYEAYPTQGVLRRTARRLPEKTAIIDGDRTFTYRQLDEYSDRCAAALAGLGVAPRDRVALLSPNCAEFVIAFFGILRAGAVVTTVNSGYREREIAHQVSDSGAGLMIVHESLLGLATAARDAIPALKRVVAIEADSRDPGSFWGMLESAPAEPPPVEVDPMSDLAALPYSSGTTGLSKGVMLTHHNLTSNIEQMLGRVDELTVMGVDDVILVHLPLFHIYGMNVLMNPTIAVGATQVMMGRFDMEEFLALISRHGVTHLYSAPPVGLALGQYEGDLRRMMPAVRFALFGAAPMSADTQMRIQDNVGFPVIQGYGLTETSPLANHDFAEPELTRPGTIGPAVSDTEEKVVDLEAGDTELRPGETGELLIRGPQVMKGYFNNPEATAESITPDGWLRTGDIVRMDADGYVTVLDRKKELIKYKGFQVPPAELEGLLLEHPAVADVAVIGKADAEAGEVPKAFVVRRQGDDVSDVDLMGFVAGRVATFKHVKEVEFVDAIPKNPSGKILRRVLVERERAKTSE